VLKQRTQHLFDDGSHQSVQQLVYHPPPTPSIILPNSLFIILHNGRDEAPNPVPNPLPCHRFRHLQRLYYSADAFNTFSTTAATKAPNNVPATIATTCQIRFFAIGFGAFNIQLFGRVVVGHGALLFGNRQKELYYSAKVVLRGG
jgi:hypothetical protein